MEQVSGAGGDEVANEKNVIGQSVNIKEIYR